MRSARNLGCATGFGSGWSKGSKEARGRFERVRMWEGAFPFREFGETGGSVAAWEGRAGWSAGLADP